MGMKQLEAAVVEAKAEKRNASLTFNRHAAPLAKSSLVKGAYYIGVSRNACIARWDGEKFLHWRFKWGRMFVEMIKHREDDEVFDVFDAWRRIEHPEVVREIPLEG